MEDTACIIYQSLTTQLIGVNTEYTHLILKGAGYFLQLQGCYCFPVIIMVYMCTNNVTIVTGIPYNFLLSWFLPAYPQHRTDVIMDLSKATEIDFIAF